METEFFCIVCDAGGERLDRFLASQMDGVSRTRIHSLITKGFVTVSGSSQKPSYRLLEGDVIEGEIPSCEPLDVLPVNIPLDIVYEDSDLIVINKAKNMVVHPAPGHVNDTLVNALLFHCGSALSGINGVLRPGILHRLDKDTTGLLLVAKTNEAHIYLSEQLSQRKIERIYEAVVYGVLTENEGEIDAPVGRHEKDRLKMCVNFKNGKTAVTHFKVIRRFDKYTHVELKLETGRTHQIRVHMAHIGHPVLGDAVYSGRKSSLAESQTLHAKSLGFTHPRTNDKMCFESGLPDYFREILRKIDGKRV